jgi:nitrous oxidase accessory protein
MINRSQNNGFLWFLMLCLSIIVCSVQLSYSVTLDVGPGKQIKSLKTAVKTSNPYDTILVDSGNYYENNLVINKPLTIIGRNNPVIDGKFQSTIIVISSDSVILKNLPVLKFTNQIFVALQIIRFTIPFLAFI